MRLSHTDYLAMLARTQRKEHGGTVAKSNDSESDIQAQIEDYLKTLIPKCWYVRCRTDRPTVFTRSGVPDFFGVYGGTAWVMEIKKPGQKPSTEQQGELHWLKLAGAKTGVVYSLEEAVKFVGEMK